jgi:hypothetical protein
MDIGQKWSCVRVIHGIVLVDNLRAKHLLGLSGVASVLYEIDIGRWTT